MIMEVVLLHAGFKTAIVMPWQKEAEPISVTKKIRVPECTKPLASFETRGFIYIEFGGEGEIRNYPFTVS